MINVVITLYWEGFIQAILLSVDGKKGTHSFNSVLKLSLCHTRKLNPFFKTDIIKTASINPCGNGMPDLGRKNN